MNPKNLSICAYASVVCVSVCECFVRGIFLHTKMKLKQLEGLLGDLQQFSNPKVSLSLKYIPTDRHECLIIPLSDSSFSMLQAELEQYPTGPHIASRMLFTVFLSCPISLIHLYKSKKIILALSASNFGCINPFCLFADLGLRRNCLWACKINNFGYFTVFKQNLHPTFKLGKKEKTVAFFF